MHKKYAAKISIFLISILSCLFLFSCADPNNENKNNSNSSNENHPETDSLIATKELYSAMKGVWRHNTTLEIQRINAHSYNYDSNGYIKKGNFTFGPTVLAPSYNITINSDGVYFTKNGNKLKNTQGEDFCISYTNLTNAAAAKNYYSEYYNFFDIENSYSAGSSSYYISERGTMDSAYDCFKAEDDDVIMASPAKDYFFYLKIKNERLYLSCIIPNSKWDNLKLTEDDCLNHTYDSNGGNVIFAIYEKTTSDNNSSSVTSSDLTGSYTISEANGSAFTFAQDGTWTYRYNSSTTEGTWSVSDGELTITYTLGGYENTAVFTVSISGDTYTLTGKSGDCTTIITSAFKITNQTAVQDGVVTLVKQ